MELFYFYPAGGGMFLEQKLSQKGSYENVKRVTLGRDWPRQISVTGRVPGGVASSPH